MIVKFICILTICFSSIAFSGSKDDENAARLRKQEITKIFGTGKIKEIKKLTNDDLPEFFSLGSLIALNIVEVVKKFGKAEEVVTGDASTSEHSICYEGKDKSVVAFVEDEMGITVEFYKDKASSFLKKCLKTDFVSKNLITRRGLKFGLTSSQTRKIYGETSKTGKDYDLYRFKKSRSPAQPFCVDYEDIFIHFHKGQVDKFTLRRGSVDC